MFVRVASVVAIGLLAGVAIQGAFAFPVGGDQTVLPVGTELNEDAINQPREVFKSEALDGRKSYLVNLGDLAFSSPTILGGAARQAGISCATCHVNGASNPKLFIPGMSTHPGTFDTTGPLFNPNTDNRTLDAVRIPSLRGARYLAPYGNDGRMASLRDFIRNVIVVEFSGPEPSPAVLDALVAYIDDIDFLPNPNLGAGGSLTTNATDAESRGESIFNKPFPHNPSLSCATCHVPSGAFVDHLPHDVGTGGLFKTPTLVNADFNGPYFHDGRYTTFGQVVAHFDRTFDLGLSAQDKHDLVAYLTAVGHGAQPYERDGGSAQILEINDFASVLGPAIAAHDKDIIALAVDTVGGELRELAEHIPDWKDTSVSGGEKERSLARTALKQVVLLLRRINIDATAGRFDEAAAEYKSFSYLMAAGIPALVSRAEPWSLFTPAVHDAHYAALRQVLRTKTTASQ
jgi:Di-haem cytochrome c peroxidase